MISIVICTYNRPEILRFCLDSLLSQLHGVAAIEVLIIDNGCSAHTRIVVDEYSKLSNCFRYVGEPVVGLSTARNRGFAEARFDWVAYLDDDAKVFPNYLERVSALLESGRFDCFGGRFIPWYLEPKPAWLPAEFGSFPSLRSDVGILPDGFHVPGGIMVLRKQMLIMVGGFPIQLGMKGKEVGYAEENWVQDQIRIRGGKIGFDPELIMHHLVADYKFSVSWHLKRMYAKGKASRYMEARVLNGFVTMIYILRAVAAVVFRLPFNMLRLIKDRNYYLQNFVLDSLGNLWRVSGYVFR